MEDAGAAAHGALFVHSEIPLARGLGSSAAAILAGYDLARAALGLPSDPDAAFRTTYRHEGHGDNAAPCLLGGLCAVVPAEDGPRPLPLPLSHEVGFAYAAPAAGISTTAARSVLPDKVPHAIAVEELGRLAALLRGLAEGDPELIRIGIEDQLHVPHRLPLIPGAFNAVSAGYDAGAWGVTISGSGSGLLALCEPGRAQAVADAMHEVLSTGTDDPESVGLALVPDLQGLMRETAAG
jgi:homoserine kinase